MFQCEVTGRQSDLGAKQNKIVVARRDRIYTKRVKNEETNRWEDVKIGEGWEIVREINATDAGLARWNTMTEEARKLLLETPVNERMHLTDE